MFVIPRSLRAAGSLVLGSLAAVLLPVAPAGAATFTVTSTSDGGVATCPATQASPCTLRQAITTASNTTLNPGPDTIEFNVTGTITLTSDLPAITESLTITGPSGGITISGNDQFQLLRFTSTANGDYLINGIALTNGKRTDPTGGGGVFFGPPALSTLRLTDVVIQNSAAAAGPGGGIAITAGNRVFITGGVISGNSAVKAGGGGGGIHNQGGELTVDGTTIDGNTVGNVSNGHGGAIFSDISTSGSTVLTRITVRNNSTASGSGGGLFASNRSTGTFTISESVFDTNTAAAMTPGVNHGHGGGIAVNVGKITLDNVTVSRNTADQDGGGIYLLGSASAAIGATNVTIADNTAIHGGGLATAINTSAPSSLVHATVTGNSATDTTGGFGIRTPNPNTVFPGNAANPFTSNIVAGNAGNQCSLPFDHNDAANSGYNMTVGMSCGFDQSTDKVVTDPKLGTLGAHGGTLETVPLLAGSAAIEAANPNFATTDQRGAFPADGDENGTLLRDIGAYEFAGFGAVAFAAANTDVNEDAGPVEIGVRRFGNTDTAASVDFATDDDGATVDEDYTAASGTLNWAADDGAPKTFSITILEDSKADEPDEKIALALSMPNAGTDLGTQSAASVTIKNVNPVPGTLQFKSATFSGSEDSGGGSVTLIVSRVDGDDTQVQVDFFTSDGSARAGSDYSTRSGTLTWSSGDAADKTITVPIVNDFMVESDETFSVTLTNPRGDGGAMFQPTLGTPSSATATILDDDSVGVAVAESGDSTDVTEGGATDSYTIALTSQPTADVTITLSFGNQIDATPTTLTFTPADFNVPQTVTVSAVDDAVVEGPQSATITHSVASADPTYDGIAVNDVAVAVTDNDTAALLLDVPGNFTVAEGGASASYTIKLATQPAADVTVTVQPDAQLTASPTQLVFTPTNFNMPQTVTISAVDDEEEQGTRTATVTNTAASADPNYDGKSSTATATVEDNDGGGGGTLSWLALVGLLGLGGLRRRR